MSDDDGVLEDEAPKASAEDIAERIGVPRDVVERELAAIGERMNELEDRESHLTTEDVADDLDIDLDRAGGTDA